MSFPHFPIHGQSCFHDKQPGCVTWGNPATQRAQVTALVREGEGEKEDGPTLLYLLETYTHLAVAQVRISLISFQLLFSFIHTTLFPDLDFCGFTATRRVLQCNYWVVSLHLDEKALHRYHDRSW